jgi:hypothetical protein
MRARHRSPCTLIAGGLCVFLLGCAGCTRRSDDAATETVDPVSATSGNPTHRADGRTPHTRRDSAKQGGGGGGAPISIPDIIIQGGHDVYLLKRKIEKSAISQCGSLCITVQVADVDKTKLLNSFESYPPVIEPPEPGADYIVKRGTRIVLHGNFSASDAPTDDPPAGPSPSAGDLGK